MVIEVLVEVDVEEEVEMVLVKDAWATKCTTLPRVFKRREDGSFPSQFSTPCARAPL